MLEQKNRIKKKKEIEEIFKKGQSFKQDFLILKTLKNNLTFSRFCFVVPKKVSKKAVDRNKIKRRIRQAVRLITNFENNTDNLIIALSEAKEKTFQEIEQTLRKLFKKAKI
jgi:ribonuclease P protein component